MAVLRQTGRCQEVRPNHREPSLAQGRVVTDIDLDAVDGDLLVLPVDALIEEQVSSACRRLQHAPKLFGLEQ